MKLVSKFRIQVISLETKAKDLYYASAEDLLTVFCLLAFQETKEFPKKIHKSVVDLLLSGHDPQSASTYACNFVSELALKRIP